MIFRLKILLYYLSRVCTCKITLQEPDSMGSLEWFKPSVLSLSIFECISKFHVPKKKKNGWQECEIIIIHYDSSFIQALKSNKCEDNH